MANSRREWLVQSLGEHLIPLLTELGFEAVSLTGEQAASLEFRTAFPFGTYRRSSSRGLELVEIQLDKRRSPAFRLNIGVAPTGGIDHALGHVAQDEVRVQYLPRYFEAYSWPKFRRWFAVRRWLGAQPTKGEYDKLVVENLGLVREIEDVLRDGTPGPHIRVIEI